MSCQVNDAETARKMSVEPDDRSIVNKRGRQLTAASDGEVHRVRCSLHESLFDLKCLHSSAQRGNMLTHNVWLGFDLIS